MPFPDQPAVRCVRRRCGRAVAQGGGGARHRLNAPAHRHGHEWGRRPSRPRQSTAAMDHQICRPAGTRRWLSEQSDVPSGRIPHGIWRAGQWPAPQAAAPGPFFGRVLCHVMRQCQCLHPLSDEARMTEQRSTSQAKGPASKALACSPSFHSRGPTESSVALIKGDTHRTISTGPACTDIGTAHYKVPTLVACQRRLNTETSYNDHVHQLQELFFFLAFSASFFVPQHFHFCNLCVQERRDTDVYTW